jgi:hypothetical protein
LVQAESIGVGQCISIIIIIDLNKSTTKDRSLRSFVHRQEVNQVRGTLATRFYTLLLQPRRRIYLIPRLVLFDRHPTPAPLEVRAIKAMASLP